MTKTTNVLNLGPGQHVRKGTVKVLVLFSTKDSPWTSSSPFLFQGLVKQRSYILRQKRGTCALAIDLL